MKKVLSILLVAVMLSSSLFLLTGCDFENDIIKNGNNIINNVTGNDKEKVKIVSKILSSINEVNPYKSIIEF